MVRVARDPNIGTYWA